MLPDFFIRSPQSAIDKKNREKLPLATVQWPHVDMQCNDCYGMQHN